jgi:hypothetical protein
MNSTRAVDRAPMRTLVDDQGRAWHVREQRLIEGNLHQQRVAESVVLVFRCDRPGVLPEIRRVSQPLSALDEVDLLQLLRSAH